MSGVRKTENAGARHGALIQRLSAICSITLSGRNVFIRDLGEETPPPPRARVVELAHGDTDRMTRVSARHFIVRYRDATGDFALAATMAALSCPDDPIAGDPESLAIFALAQRIAGSDIQVLINGPTGTGKEVLSRFVHSRSDRADKPFVAINCAAMPETMLEAMLFGYQKGAFTGANAASEGFFRAADGGTLLLDEITEMPLPLQAKLLRALQEQEVVPIGSTTPVKVNVRVVAAANRDLPEEVAEGRFRQDLYYRLNVFPLTLSALCERGQDIALLAQAMIMRHTPANGDMPVITDSAVQVLRGHDWPGNVRELENVVRRALLLSNGAMEITDEHIMFDRAPGKPAVLAVPPRISGDVIPFAARGAARPGGEKKLSSFRSEQEAMVIMEALDACGGNRTRTAKRLGIAERTLRYRLAAMRDAGFDIDNLESGGMRCRR